MHFYSGLFLSAAPCPARVFTCPCFHGCAINRVPTVRAYNCHSELGTCISLFKAQYVDPHRKVVGSNADACFERSVCHAIDRIAQLRVGLDELHHLLRAVQVVGIPEGQRAYPRERV